VEINNINVKVYNYQSKTLNPIDEFFKSIEKIHQTQIFNYLSETVERCNILCKGEKLESNISEISKKFLTKLSDFFDNSLDKLISFIPTQKKGDIEPSLAYFEIISRIKYLIECLIITFEPIVY